MKETPQRKKNLRMQIVLLGGSFVFLIIVMVKFIGNGPIVPMLFFAGWLVLAVLVFAFFRGYKWR